jgi:hypothetical protein
MWRESAQLATRLAQDSIPRCAIRHHQVIDRLAQGGSNAADRDHPGARSMADPVRTSDHLLAEYLGASLQTATVRLTGGLIVLAAIVALVIKIL